MVQTAKSRETVHTLKSKIAAVYQYLIENGDLENADKIKQLAGKLENREFTIAFCGHFSAGKSTMINQVIGENLLPSSPIPTSANLVKVMTGEDYAKVFFKSEKPRVYLAPYDYELVKNYCKDGDQIKEIEISHSQTKLPANTVIMDTPGIDSADDAHRIATESAIHLADLIFYVMDYNHVQAELNFLFTKELTEAGKEIYLVVNQIDKHKNEELSFQEFQASVLHSFSSWGVNPPHIFYTSLKQKDHIHNEFTGLQQFIAEKLMSKDERLFPSVLQSLQKIVLEHLKQAKKKDEAALKPKIEILEQLSEQEQKGLNEMYQQIHSSLQTISTDRVELEREFDSTSAQIMKNAYLMPFQTRALAEAFLESCQPEFKVGFLFTRQKTGEEKQQRLESFYQNLLEKTKTQLEWHLRESLVNVLKEKELNQGELLELAQSFSIQFPIDLLTRTVKRGARLTGEYVLLYTDDVANEIKKIARAKLAEFKAVFLDLLINQNVQLQQQYEMESRRIGQYLEALKALNDFQENVMVREKEINQAVANGLVMVDDYAQLFHQTEEEFEIVKGNTSVINGKSNRTLPKMSDHNTVSNEKTKQLPDDNGDLKHTAVRLQQTSAFVKDLPGFQKLAQELEEKATRLANKGFTVALFGAFSAGKSSFANALIGEKVLPVSPNPTTAAINKIKPVTETIPHGTVLVKFKEEAAMLEDVNRSLKVFNMHAVDFKEASEKAAQVVLQKNQENLVEKTHITFLQAFSNGFGQYEKMLGTVLQTNVDEFKEFVANEEKSCYVEWIELYYDCELTRKGITLVDTPGADSINARHTGVAFDYIKNSDAILFVTYYNHAFSKADREFLIQLGRVKDSFQMDKMFFIINAIDLAENEEEKETVVQYVREQLGKYGIRKPHLYTVSSLLAINEKILGEAAQGSGIVDFEQEFYQFISNGLSKMAILSAESELQRVQGLIAKLIQSSKEDETIKGQKRSTIEKQQALIQELLEMQTVEPIKDRLYQEIEELIFYIKQRVFFRFSDFFKEAFNPSTLRDDGRNLKTTLAGAMDEFIESFGFDFAQEMRATTVRLDRYAEKVLTDYHLSLVRSFQGINEDLSFSMFETENKLKIEFHSAFNQLDLKIIAKAMTYFKNPKSFFEKNEKKLMSDELYKVLQAPADQYLTEEGNRLKQFYSSMVTQEFNRLVNQMNEEQDDFYVSFHSTLNGGVSLKRLVDIQERLLNFTKI